MYSRRDILYDTDIIAGDWRNRVANAILEPSGMLILPALESAATALANEGWATAYVERNICPPDSPCTPDCTHLCMGSTVWPAVMRNMLATLELAAVSVRERRLQGRWDWVQSESLVPAASAPSQLN